ncbi:immunoglobulin-like domain-containing protein [Paenibacillus sp. CF384]|uniref:immunoglobulin-like domain-containing protein n=1 Tax=Paenibacillus sp. CF384 TaxID=1884382 RepID=UPI00089CCAD4|nr:immunoglobulin-like domain-containing protein [Paenibacillus sp. CF384]SDX95957.1 Serine protease, subtilisin family [Paenibacillus sp. CF384]
MKRSKRMTKSVVSVSLACLVMTNMPLAYAAADQPTFSTNPNKPASAPELPKGIIVKNPDGKAPAQPKLTPEQLQGLKEKAKQNLSAAMEEDRKKELESLQKVPAEAAAHNPDELVSVIVQLKGQTVSQLAAQGKVGVSQQSLTAGKTAIQNEIDTTQSKIMSTLAGSKAKSGNGLSFKHEYQNVFKGFSVDNIKYSSIEAIKKMPNVAAVTLQQKYYPAEVTNQEHELTGIENVWSGAAVGQDSGYKGEGMLIAILDTGIDYTHEAFPAPHDMSKARFAKGTGKYSDKVVAGYNWADQTDDVIPHMEDTMLSPSSHGVHVAGTAAGSSAVLRGVAPEAQLVAEKVFSDIQPGALTEDIIKGIDHASSVGADVINMSLGSASSFDTRDPKDPMGIAIRNATDAGHVVVVSAGNASNAYADRGELGAHLKLGENPDLNKVGNPGVYPDSFTVAAANNIVEKHTYEFQSADVAGSVFGEGIDDWHITAGQTYELAAFPADYDWQGYEIGFGTPSDYEGVDVTGKVMLVKRGAISFIEKVKHAEEAGAAGIIVYNSSPDKLAPPPQGFGIIPFSFISYEDGMKLKEAILANIEVGGGGGGIDIGPLDIGIEVPGGSEEPAPLPSIQISIASEEIGSAFDESNPGQPTDFTSWGTTSDLLLKPEVMAPGHAILSSVRTSDPNVNNAYEKEDGTSMAAPYVSGAVADVMQALKERGVPTGNRAFAQLVKNLIMNTSVPTKRDYVNEENSASRPDYNTEYQPRRQGAGMIRPDLAVQTPVVVAGADGKGSVSLKEIGRTATFTLTAKNMTDKETAYTVNGTIMTDYLHNSMLTHSDNIRSRYMEEAELTFDHNQITVPANSTKQVVVTLNLDASTMNNIFVEGYVYLTPTDSTLPTLNVPYNGFFGDWDEPSIIDAPVWEDTHHVWAESGLGTQMGFQSGPYQFFYDLPDTAEEIALGDKYYVFNPRLGMVPFPVLTMLRDARTINVDVVDEDHNLVTHLANEEWQVKMDPYSGGNPYTLVDGTIWGGRNLGIESPDGQYYFAVTATADIPNAKPQPTIYMPMYKDTQAPTINVIKNPEYDESTHPEVADNGNYTLRWTVDDEVSGSTNANIFLALNGSEPWDDYKSMVVHNPDGSYQLEVPGLINGLNVVTLAPIDSVGNEGDFVNIVIDNSSSKGLFVDEYTTTINDSLPSGYWNANVQPGDQFTLSFDAFGTSLASVKQVLYKLEDSGTLTKVGATIDDSATWETKVGADISKFPITGHVTIPSNLPDGHYITFFACLEDGSVWEAAETVSGISDLTGSAYTGIHTYVDTQAPTVKLNTEMSADLTQTSAYVDTDKPDIISLMLDTVAQDTVANSRGYKLEVAVDGNSSESMGSILRASTVEEDFRYPVVLNAGEHVLVVKATDFLGNTSSITINVTVDLAGNVVQVTNDGAGGTATIPIQAVQYAKDNTPEFVINPGGLWEDGSFHLDNMDPLVSGYVLPAYANNGSSDQFDRNLVPIVLLGNEQALPATGAYYPPLSSVPYNSRLYYNAEPSGYGEPAGSYTFYYQQSGYTDPGSIPQGDSELPFTMIDYMGNKTTIKIPVHKNSEQPRVELDNVITDATGTASFYTTGDSITITGTVFADNALGYDFAASLQDYRRSIKGLPSYKSLFDDNWVETKFDQDLKFPDSFMQPAGEHRFSITIDDLQHGGNFLGIESGLAMDGKVFSGYYTSILNLVVYKMGGEESADQFQAAQAVNNLTWDMLNGANVDEAHVSTNLSLPTSDPGNHAKITWSSDNPNVINETGQVTRPAAEQAVKLTATATMGTATAERVFNLTVLAAAATDELATADDAASVTWDVIRGDNETEADVSSVLSLPTHGSNGSTITWASNKPRFITNQGRVFIPLFDEGDANVDLVATVTKGDSTSKTTFNLTVLCDTKNKEKTLLLRAAKSLKVSDLLGENASELFVTSNLNFPTTYGEDGIQIEWLSEHEEIVAPDGTVTRPADLNAYVPVAAYLTLGNYYMYVDFGFYVRSLDQEVALVWNMIKGGNDSQNAVTANLYLPTVAPDGSEITWTSSNESVVESNGTVHRSNQDVEVTLSATTTKYKILVHTTAFHLVVLAAPSSSDGGFIGGGTDNAGEEHSVVIDPGKLSNPSDGVVSIEVPANTSEVKLPANAADLLADNKLEVNTGNVTLEIPSALLEALTGKLTAEELKNGQISLKLSALSDTEKEALEKASSTASYADVKAVGGVYELELSVTDATGKKLATLSTFNEPITIRLKVDASANLDNTGIFYVSGDGKLEYIGGTLENGELVAEISHFSKYAVLEVTKTFTDVSSSHWAAKVIQSLAAKQIINGTSPTMFTPNRNVTRAEFTAMLVKALKLTAAGDTTFKDVAADAWYARAVSIAVKAGIVSGKSSTAFAPSAQITREEMATMLMRAYAVMKGSEPAKGAEASFTDASAVSAWAADYVDAAASLKLINGRGEGKFDPKGITTRAEAAQVMYNLITIH